MRFRGTLYLRQRLCVLALLAHSALAPYSALATPKPGQDTSAAKTSNSVPIKIGFISSCSGVGAASGLDMVNGFKLYFDQIHNQIKGRKVELIIENDESSPVTAVTKARKLIEEDKVAVVDGIALSNIAYAVAPVMEQYQTPFLLAIAGADDLTKRKNFNWLIRTGYANSQPTQAFGEYVYKTLGYKKVSILAVDYAYGWEASGGFQKSFEDVGGKVVQRVWAPLGIKDFTSYIQKLKRDVDAVFFVTVAGAAEIIPKEYKSAGLKLPVLGAGPSYDELVLRKSGDETLGAISPMFYSAALHNPANKRFLKDYRDKFDGSDPSLFAEGGYTSAMWISKAIEALNGNVEDKNALLAELKKVQLQEAPRGPVRGDDHSNPIQNIYIRKVQRVNGKLQNVVVHTFKDVSQFWKYDEVDYLKQPPFSRDYPPCKYCND